MTAPRLAWYGDDFTGASAVMDVLAQAGLRAVLFTKMPGPGLAARYAGWDAVGLAGTARARGPDWMRAHLPAVFDWLDASGAPLVHYKVCSTFDSAPELGSIGVATEIGLSRLGDWAPCLTAAPSMGRWQCYGTLFARGPDGRAHRLDRHPVMRDHPATPMDEADLRRHLARQTDLPIALIDLDGLKRDVPEDARRGVVLIDAQREADMRDAGRILADGGARLLLGSQGVEMALVAHWRAHGVLPAPPEPPAIDPRPTLIASGSVSVTTAAQIDRAEAAGGRVIRLDAAALVAGGPDAETAIAQAADAACEAGFPVIATARGPDDPSLADLCAARDRHGLTPERAAEAIGAGLGATVARVLGTGRFGRLVVAGGDSSGHAMSRLPVGALTVRAHVAEGAPLMRAEDGPLQGLEIALKGGQMGGPDLFVRLRDGT